MRHYGGVEIPAALFQFLGSLAAIIAVAWLVRKMKLGPPVRIADEDHARELAEEQLDGYEPVKIAVDRAGYGAIMRDGDGRIMVLKPHGAHVAGRILTSHASCRLDRNQLTLGTADKRFGSVTLDLGNDRENGAAHWAASLRRL
ncbi:hypothetical protein GRI68_12515 [Altererythrobacter halimionae]|uniref:Uncharacterized protein n=2 Tax=Alteriqipengyuania halimionae TaxID=1926630 RepID=A0A6I4U920_9SPHN|nr:hypothetical protein [Alteriqipengyuania halimionae]